MCVCVCGNVPVASRVLQDAKESESCVREWYSCVKGMRARVSSTLFWLAAAAKLTIKAGAGPK